MTKTLEYLERHAEVEEPEFLDAWDSVFANIRDETELVEYCYASFILGIKLLKKLTC